MPKPAVLIYTEAGPTVGYGHVVRCSHLARELKRLGAEVQAYPGYSTTAGDYLLERGFPGGVSGDIGVLDVMRWNDAVVQSFRRRVDKLVVIVGAGQSPGARANASLMVYQTGWMPYGNLGEYIHVPSVAGPDYLILAPAYKSPQLESFHKLDALVVFGAGIPWRYSVETSEALSSLGLTGTLVVPPYHRGEFQHTKAPKGFREVQSPASLHALQARHKFQVGSVGMSTYEAVAARCVPIVVGRSPDHVATGDRLTHLRMAYSAGSWDDVAPETLAKLAHGLVPFYNSIVEEMPVIDGLGAERVARRILELT